MKRQFIFSSLALLVPFLIIGISNSADLFTFKVGQKFIYIRTNSAEPPDLWFSELRVIEEVTVCYNDYFHFQLWNYNNESDIENHYNRSTENNIYVCDTVSGIECSAIGNGAVGTTWTCGDDFIEIMEPEQVNVPYGGPYTAVVNRKYNYIENSPHRFEYIVPGMGWVKQVDYWDDNPPAFLDLVQRTCIGDIDEDGDVDGSDLSIQASEGAEIDLKFLADHFGVNDCDSTLFN